MLHDLVARRLPIRFASRLIFAVACARLSIGRSLLARAIRLGPEKARTALTEEIGFVQMVALNHVPPV